jgi:dipeptidyl aminopeptidase/acylaminoacyl peptidase
VLVLAAAFAFATAVAPADRLPMAYSSVSISPDGRNVVAIESGGGFESDKPVQTQDRLIVYPVAGGKPNVVALPCAQDERAEHPTDQQARCTPSSPSWSPDGSTIVFILRDTTQKTRDLYLVNADGTHPRRILAFNGTLGRARFTRDGHAIAVLATANARKEVGATQAGIRIAGEIGTTNDVQRVAVASFDGTLRFVSPADLYVYEFDETGDGFVGTGAHGNGDNNWWIARLYLFDPKTAAARELYKPASIQQQIAAPHVSRDGKLLAFVGGIMSDFGSTGGDVYVYRLDDTSGRAIDITPNMPASATSLAWDCDRDRLSFTELQGGRTGIASVDFPFLEPQPKGGPMILRPFVTQPKLLWLDAIPVREVSASCTGALAGVRESHEMPAEIVTTALAPNGTIASWKELTHGNAGIPPEARAQSVNWTSDGFNVSGWLLSPRSVEAGKKYPLIVDVHGGPSAASTPRFIGRGTVRSLLRKGYFVFFPNPRGSFGQGEAFTLANVKDFGGGDFRDIMSGLDAIEKVALIDDARLGIMGGSYGGYMTMWAVTQTNRFKAGVSAAGLSNWQSYYGENGIDEWMLPFFGASVYDDPAVYAKSSPINFIKNVKTPTFAYVGELDVEVPAPQSLEFWHALETLGVPTSLVIYPGEGHRLRSPAHTRDAEKRTLDWFDKYLKP